MWWTCKIFGSQCKRKAHIANYTIYTNDDADAWMWMEKQIDTKKRRKNHTHTCYALSRWTLFHSFENEQRRVYVRMWIICVAKKVWEKRITRATTTILAPMVFKCSDIHGAISSLSNRVYLISTNNDSQQKKETMGKNRPTEPPNERTNEQICVHLNKWHLWIKIYCVWSSHIYIMLTHFQQLMTSRMHIRMSVWNANVPFYVTNSR